MVKVLDFARVFEFVSEEAVDEVTHVELASLEVKPAHCILHSSQIQVLFAAVWTKDLSQFCHVKKDDLGALLSVKFVTEDYDEGVVLVEIDENFGVLLFLLRSHQFPHACAWDYIRAHNCMLIQSLGGFLTN